VEKIWIALACSIFIVFIGITTYLFWSSPSEEGWEDVPREVFYFDQFPGEGIIITGRLEANDRVILAIPKVGEIEPITEQQVDRIVEQGLREEYDFRKPGWTHRLISDLDVIPSYEEGGSDYYLLKISGTSAWSASDVYSKYEGKEVEILGKWDSFTDPEIPSLNIVQFWGKSIRRVD
jgi:hypothetical protein